MMDDEYCPCCGGYIPLTVWSPDPKAYYLEHAQLGEGEVWPEPTGACAERELIDLDRHPLFICPFHNDEHGAMQVDPNDGRFHCLECSATGDVVTFHQLTQGIRTYEAAYEQLQLWNQKKCCRFAS
jgi:hypothetical protein